MSNPSPDIAGVIAEARQIQIALYATISGAALVFFDYAITLSTEISEIWNSKFSGAQALFFLTRYSFMIFTVFLCADVLALNQSETWCRSVGVNVVAWGTIPHIALYGILTLRTYAIYQKSPFILIILGLTGGANIAVTLYGDVLSRSEVGSSPSGLGNSCQIAPPSNFPQLQLAAVILALVLDVLVFTLTFAKTIRHSIEMRKVGLGNGLGYFILRDGAMYFLAKLLIGVMGTILFFIPASVSVGSWIVVLVQISDPLNIILINRLVLNLRQVSHVQEGNGSNINAIGSIHEPAFAANSFLGNLGAQLRVGPEDDDEIEEIGIDDDAAVVEESGNMDHGEITEVPCHPSDV